MDKEIKREGGEGEGRNLIGEVMEIYERSILSKRDAEFNYGLICKLAAGVVGDRFEGLTYSEKEAVIKESEVLMSRLRISIEELKRLDGRYEDLRRRINKYYGKEVLGEQGGIDYEGMLGDLSGSGEEETE